MFSNTLRKKSAAGLVIFLVCSAFASALVIESYDTVFWNFDRHLVCPVIHEAMGPGDAREYRGFVIYDDESRAYRFSVQRYESGWGVWLITSDVLAEPLPDYYFTQSIKSAYMQAIASDRHEQMVWLQEIAGYSFSKPSSLLNSSDSIMDMSILLADHDGDGVMNLADADYTFEVPEPGSLFAFAGGWLLLRRKCKHGAA